MMDALRLMHHESPPQPVRSDAVSATIWTPIPSASPIDDLTLAETLSGGQCFRWLADVSGEWRGISGSTVARLRVADGEISAAVSAGSIDDLGRHLGADIDWVALADLLPLRTDGHLARCMAAFPGLRILRQPFGETLLCFMCSATKQIVQIQEMVRLLAARFGHRLDDGSHALPGWGRLTSLTDAELRECKLGFRAKNIAATAAFLADRPGWLKETASLSYSDAKNRLVTLPGVGAKIADCTLLFGAGRLEAFPVDVWVLRTLRNRYGLHGWSAESVAHFGRAHFGPLAGLAQQYLFAWERRHGRAEP